MTFPEDPCFFCKRGSFFITHIRKLFMVILNIWGMKLEKKNTTPWKIYKLKKTKLKGLSAIDHSKRHFFSKPPGCFFLFLFLLLILFCIFRDNYTVLTYLYKDSLRNGIFSGREAIICCWEMEIIYHRRWLNLASVASCKLFESWFLIRFNVFFHLWQQYVLFWYRIVI